jgi:dihydroxyacetone kinase-like predicted kinase
MLKQLMNAMTHPPDEAQNDDADKQLEDLVKVFTRPDASRQLKLMLARNMSKMENDALGLSGPDGTVIVTERNKAAIRALEKTLKSGKKDIAIFYGAAHMPDMSQRLEKLGFAPVKTDWRLAWDLTIRPGEPSAVEKALMELIKGLDDATR